MPSFRPVSFTDRCLRLSSQDGGAGQTINLPFQDRALNRELWVVRDCMSLTSITCRTGEACTAIAETGRPVAVPHVGALDTARVGHAVLGREIRPSSSHGTRFCLEGVQNGSAECRARERTWCRWKLLDVLRYGPPSDGSLQQQNLASSVVLNDPHSSCQFLRAIQRIETLDSVAVVR